MSDARASFAFGREIEDDAPVPREAYVVGEQPWWQPGSWPSVLASSKSLREQLRRARAKRVVVRRRDPRELAEGTDLRRRADELVARWLRARHMAPMAFEATVAPFADLTTRAIFVATIGAEVVGLLSAKPLSAKPPLTAAPSESEPSTTPPLETGTAWMLEHVLRTRDAPNGTAELLVDAAMASLGTDASVTLGLAPLFGRVPAPLSFVRRTTRGLFDFQGLADFKLKLKPQRWRRVLVEHPGQGALFGTLRVLRAFAGGSLLAFAFKSALRGPPPLIRLVAALLVPWLIGLALVDARMFPSPWVQRAWIAFDIALVPALYALARRITRRTRRRWLHVLLAVAITLDAVATTAQAIVWNAPRIQTGAEAAIVVAACVAPAVVAALLWSSLRHRE